MHRSRVLTIGLLCVLTIVGLAPPCPLPPDFITGSKSTIDTSPRRIVARYFEASKKADAKTATSLIHYEDWAKELNLKENKKKLWIEDHRSSLQDSYDEEKKAGSSKEYKILSTKQEGHESVFEVSQERVSGKYIWEVRLFKKDGKWWIKGFKLLRIERNGGERMIVL